MVDTSACSSHDVVAELSISHIPALLYNSIIPIVNVETIFVAIIELSVVIVALPIDNVDTIEVADML